MDENWTRARGRGVTGQNCRWSGSAIEQGAEAHGFRGAVWTTQRVAAVIKKRFGVSYHPAHMSRLLKQLNYSVQQPEEKATQRDEAAIVPWKEEQWPALKKAQEEERTIIFVDEAEFYLLPLLVCLRFNQKGIKMNDQPFQTALAKIEKASDRKKAFFDLCALYDQANAEQRSRLRTAWPMKRRWSLPLTRTLLITDIYPSEQRVRASLILFSLQGNRPDFRDDLIELSAIYHCAARIGLDSQRLFEEVARLSGEEAARFLRDFCHRLPEDRDIKAFGFHEEQTPDGVYLAGWGPYKGNCYSFL